MTELDGLPGGQDYRRLVSFEDMRDWWFYETEEDVAEFLRRKFEQWDREGRSVTPGSSM